MTGADGVSGGCRPVAVLRTRSTKWSFNGPEPMIYQRFGEEAMTRISRTVQLIPQFLRDTLRYAAQGAPWPRKHRFKALIAFGTRPKFLWSFSVKDLHLCLCVSRMRSTTKSGYVTISETSQRGIGTMGHGKFRRRGLSEPSACLSEDTKPAMSSSSIAKKKFVRPPAGMLWAPTASARAWAQTTGRASLPVVGTR